MKKILLMILGALLIVSIVLFLRGNLVIFDPCEARAAQNLKGIPDSEATKMYPLTFEEKQQLKKFPDLEKIYLNSSPSTFSHEVLQCYFHGENHPFFKW